MKKEGIIFLVSLVLITSFIYASFLKGDSSHEIETQYASSDFIRGWINISLENEKDDSLFEDNFDNSISLIKLLRLNNNSDYTCSPSDCNSNFEVSNPETVKIFTLNKNQQKVFGFKFTGEDFESTSSSSVNISSNIGSSASKQIFIDILNDDEIEWQAYNPANNFYGENYGCYESPSEEVLIYSQEYCGEIYIPIAPNVEIGANVISETGENAVFVLSLDGEGISSSCEVIASSTGRIACVPDIKIDKKQNFNVCIKTKTSSDDNKFKINSETTNVCGYAGTEENERDFEIFAKPGKFAAVGNFLLNSNEIQNSGSNTNMEAYISDYVERYNNDCSGGCIIPIRFISEENNQEVTISDVSIFYVASGTPKETSEIYDLTEIQAEINSNFSKIYLDEAKLSVSGEFDEKEMYSLKLNDEEIFSEEISFEKVPKIISLNPKTVIAAYPSKFRVETELLDSEISNYEWDFGGNDKKTTTENEIIYTYNSLGDYELTIKITDSNKVSASRTFEIKVKTPKEAIDFVLKRELDNLNNINTQIENFETFHQVSLNDILNLTSIEDEVINIQKKNSTAQTDEDYISIMEDLVKLNIPKSLFESKKAESIKFPPNKDHINLEILKEIARGEYEENEKDLYAQAILSWGIENIDSKITFKELSAEYEEFTRMILNTFKLNINENGQREDFYFIIKDLENLEFKENYGQRSLLGYTYIKLGNEEKIIEFSTTESVDFTELPVFISPEIKKLSIVRGEIISDAEEKGKTLLFLLFLFIIVIGFISYIILQEWYKRKYENYLFKNKNNLYNIISYIETSKKKGTENEDIAKGLRKVGWNKEQVDYVMKKYAGKRTGMFEIIPIQKILTLLKKKRTENIQQKEVQNNNQKLQK